MCTECRFQYLYMLSLSKKGGLILFAITAKHLGFCITHWLKEKSKVFKIQCNIVLYKYFTDIENWNSVSCSMDNYSCVVFRNQERRVSSLHMANTVINTDTSNSEGDSSVAEVRPLKVSVTLWKSIAIEEYSWSLKGSTGTPDDIYRVQSWKKKIKARRGQERGEERMGGDIRENWNWRHTIFIWAFMWPGNPISL